MLAVSAPRANRRAIRTGVPLVLGAAGVAIGLALRLAPVLQADFPLNDGGLFSAMIDAVRAGGFALPASVHYNGLDIPFGYPPLGFYLAAVAADLAHTSSANALRFLPLAFTLALGCAFFLLARSVMRSPLGLALSTAAFWILPGSFLWLIGGGGLTRALGLTFAVLGLREVYLLSVRGSNAAAARLAVFFALAVLSHLEMAWFLAYSSVVVFLALGRSWGNFARGVAAAVGATVLSAPWWISVLMRHGPAPFQNAGTTGSVLFSSDADLGMSVVMIGLVLLCFALAATGDERLFLVAWFGLVFLVGSRSLWLVQIGLALAFGHVADGLSLFFELAREQRRPESALMSLGPPSAMRPPPHPNPLPRWGRGGIFRSGSSLPTVGSMGITLFALITVAAISNLSISNAIAARDVLFALSADDRAALQWARANTPADSRFIVVSGGQWWARDRIGEWMPYLANRVVMTTAQGTEWLPGDEFGRRIVHRDQLQQCATRDGSCLATWERETGTTFSHVYVTRSPDDCCAALREALRGDPGYRLAYEGPAASIFERVT